jgi:hypothetical protein
MILMQAIISFLTSVEYLETILPASLKSKYTARLLLTPPPTLSIDPPTISPLSKSAIIPTPAEEVASSPVE